MLLLTLCWQHEMLAELWAQLYNKYWALHWKRKPSFLTRNCLTNFFHVINGNGMTRIRTRDLSVANCDANPYTNGVYESFENVPRLVLFHPQRLPWIPSNYQSLPDNLCYLHLERDINYGGPQSNI